MILQSLDFRFQHRNPQFDSANTRQIAGREAGAQFRRVKWPASKFRQTPATAASWRDIGALRHSLAFTGGLVRTQGSGRTGFEPLRCSRGGLRSPVIQHYRAFGCTAKEGQAFPKHSETAVREASRKLQPMPGSLRATQYV